MSGRRGPVPGHFGEPWRPRPAVGCACCFREAPAAHSSAISGAILPTADAWSAGSLTAADRAFALPCKSDRVAGRLSDRDAWHAQFPTPTPATMSCFSGQTVSSTPVRSPSRAAASVSSP